MTIVTCNKRKEWQRQRQNARGCACVHSYVCVSVCVCVCLCVCERERERESERDPISNHKFGFVYRISFFSCLFPQKFFHKRSDLVPTEKICFAAGAEDQSKTIKYLAGWAHFSDPVLVGAIILLRGFFFFFLWRLPKQKILFALKNSARDQHFLNQGFLKIALGANLVSFQFFV